MKQPIKEKLRIDLREKYKDTFFREYQGKDLPAQHRFCASGDDSVIMSFSANPVLQSHDRGKTWDYYQGRRTWRPFDRLLQTGHYLLGIRSGREFWRSMDGGMTWGPVKQLVSARDVHFSQIGRWNFFTAMMTLDGRIVIAGDHSLGKPDVGPDAICTISSGDWGESWEFSRLFCPAKPLPNAPEGFAEPAVVEMPNGELWMVMRSLYGELWQCISQDGGLTWNEPTPTGLASPISNCYANRLPASGATLLCWNFTKPGATTDRFISHNVYRPRNNLVFAVSHDNCKTWSCPVVVEKNNGEYPAIHFTHQDMFIMYQSSDEKIRPWSSRGLTLVRYDRREVDSLPAWTKETIQPYIDEGLVAHWLAVNCKE